MDLIIDYLDEVALGILLINTILFCWSSIRAPKFLPLKIFSIYMLSMCVVQGVTTYYAFKGMNNLFLSHFYLILQFVMVSFFYYLLFNKKQQWFVKLTGIIVLLALVIDFSLNPEKLLVFSLFEVFMTSIPLVIYAIIHLYNSLTQKTRFLYINAGLVIYLSLSTLIFLLANTLMFGGNRQLAMNIWDINVSAYVLYQFLILLEWARNRTTWKTKTLS